MTLKQFLLNWQGCIHVKNVSQAFKAAVLTEDDFNSIVTELTDDYPSIAPFTPIDAALEEIENYED